MATTFPSDTAAPVLDVSSIREHFDFVRAGRVVTNNAATTQPPRELLELYRQLTTTYENVHRGQSAASRHTTELFEDSYDTIAGWLNAPSRRSVVLGRNTTEAINTVVYALLTEFRDGDNVVTTMLEHNSNFVPWYALCNEILPRFGRRVECRVARLDRETGRLDLDHLAGLVDTRTKLVACTGASNFLGTKPPLERIREITSGSGYRRPSGESGSLLLVDAAQLVPSTAVDVQALDVDLLAFSFHKMLAPFGVGVLYAREELLTQALPFLYGGDMIAEGRVRHDQVEYADLPWKYAAGTPNILGSIVSAQALRLVLDLALPEQRGAWFGTSRHVEPAAVAAAMERIGAHTRRLTARALTGLQEVDGLTVLGPLEAGERSPLVAFTVRGVHPLALAAELDALGVESRAGCHCAALAHRELALDPPASCRLSFALYTSDEDVDRAVAAVHLAVARLRRP